MKRQKFQSTVISTPLQPSVASPQPQHQVESGLLLDVVIRQGPSILQLLASKDKPLLIRGDTLLVLQDSHNIN